MWLWVEKVGNEDEELRDEGFFLGSFGVFAASDGGGGSSGGVKGCHTIRDQERMRDLLHGLTKWWWREEVEWEEPLLQVLIKGTQLEVEGSFVR